MPRRSGQSCNRGPSSSVDCLMQFNKATWSPDQGRAVACWCTVFYCSCIRLSKTRFCDGSRCEPLWPRSLLLLMVLQDSTPGLGQLEPLLATVIDHPASWSTSIQGSALEPSHIKQLLTTAPKDMKAAKEQRMRGRATAKERRRTKSQLARVGTGS